MATKRAVRLIPVILTGKSCTEHGPVDFVLVPVLMQAVTAELETLRRVWEPHTGQVEFLANDSRFKILACGRRWGKTDVCAAQTVLAMLHGRPTKHLILAPTAEQARLTWDRARAMLESGMLPLPKPKVRESPYPKMTVGEHTVTARSGHVPRSLRGLEATHIVVDEAAYLPEALVTDVAMPMLATTDGQITLASTPFGKNHFWKFFQMGRRGEQGVWSKSAPSSESPFVSQRFLAVQRELVSERAFAVEYEAQFLDHVGQVFPSESVQACLQPSVAPTSGPWVIGVDWARYADYTAVAVLSGHTRHATLERLQRFQGASWASTVERVASLACDYPDARIVCDATGVGDPVLEALRACMPGRAVEGLVFTSVVKSELIDRLAWTIERRAIAMAPDPQLLREFENYESRTTAHGLALGARSGYHDDLVTALALAVRLLPHEYRPQILLGDSRIFCAHQETNTENEQHLETL